MTEGSQGPAARRAALDEVRRLAERTPPLREAAVADLLGAAAGGDPLALERLVAHHLWLVRDAVLARPTAAVPVADLVQEGSAALVVGIRRHIAEASPAAQLTATLRRDVDRELDQAEAREREVRAEEARWVADSDVYAAAEVRVRRERGRPPTTGELAVLLHWEEERVDRVREMVTRAQAAHDVDLLAIIAEVGDEPADGGDAAT